MQKVIGTRAFLKKEGFEFSLKSHQLDQKFRRMLSTESEEALDELELIPVGVDRSSKLYAIPQNLRQAHMLLSHDVARVVGSFDWLASVADGSPGPILDLGTGTGALPRLINSRHPSIQILGLDCAPNLVSIAKSATGSPNVSFAEMNYSELPSLDQKFDLILSACGFHTQVLDHVRGDDTAEPQCLPASFTISSSLMSRWDEHFGSILATLRTLSQDGARLAMVERITGFAMFVSFVAVAAQKGWRFDLSQSRRLRLNDEVMPGMFLYASEPHELSFDLHTYSRFWSGENYKQFPVKDEQAILAYLELEPWSKGVDKETFPNGTMFTESGQFADGRNYSYRYATTGFRELAILG